MFNLLTTLYFIALNLSIKLEKNKEQLQINATQK